MGVRRPRQDRSSPPTSSEGAGGLLDLCQALPQLAQPPWIPLPLAAPQPRGRASFLTCALTATATASCAESAASPEGEDGHGGTPDSRHARRDEPAHLPGRGATIDAGDVRDAAGISPGAAGTGHGLRPHTRADLLRLRRCAGVRVPGLPPGCSCSPGYSSPSSCTPPRASPSSCRPRRTHQRARAGGLAVSRRPPPRSCCARRARPCSCRTLGPCSCTPRTAPRARRAPGLPPAAASSAPRARRRARAAPRSRGRRGSAPGLGLPRAGTGPGRSPHSCRLVRSPSGTQCHRPGPPPPLGSPPPATSSWPRGSAPSPASCTPRVKPPCSCTPGATPPPSGTAGLNPPPSGTPGAPLAPCPRMVHAVRAPPRPRTLGKPPRAAPLELRLRHPFLPSCPPASSCRRRREPGRPPTRPRPCS
ncbi:uncharacterized protein LOC113459002 [Zonotrichia albicollis]|uniref:uncharacterized protein LOC113459002 n=1 Tax=Zonotrichia albicollis TaxID=44394 RepID=UPI003D80E4BC